MDTAPNPSPDSPTETTPPRAGEPVFARVLQALILIAGLLLLFSVILGRQIGPAIVGGVLFVSAFPPIRRFVDSWLVGETQGRMANQAAVLRVGAGAAIVLLAVFGLIPL